MPPPHALHLTALDVLRRTGVFSLRLVRSNEWDSGKPTKWPTHETVLRPILRRAKECWVYGLKPGSDVFELGRPILTAAGSKSRVRLDGDPITGFEGFWNASAGRRG